jgi:hypothetical protein
VHKVNNCLFPPEVAEGKERFGYDNLGDFKDVDFLIKSFSIVELTRRVRISGMQC